MINFREIKEEYKCINFFISYETDCRKLWKEVSSQSKLHDNVYLNKL